MKRPTPTMETVDICRCDEQDRVTFTTPTETGDDEPIELCQRCGRIHSVPKRMRMETNESPKTLHDWVQTALVAEQHNLDRLLDLYQERVGEWEEELESVDEQLSVYRRRYPQTPNKPSAHHSQSMRDYERLLRRRAELESLIHTVRETLALLEAEDDPDEEQFESVRKLAGLPDLNIWSYSSSESSVQNRIQSEGSDANSDTTRAENASGEEPDDEPDDGLDESARPSEDTIEPDEPPSEPPSPRKSES